MVSLIDKVCMLDNVIDDDDLNYIDNLLNSSEKWIIQSSDPVHKIDSQFKFLMLKLDDDIFFTDFLFCKIKKHIGNNFKIERVYANGQYFGMPGRPHFDSSEENRYTFLIYVNKCWDVLWGGQTIFFDKFIDTERKKITISSKTLSFYPKPKSSLFFPSNLYHYAESPTKNCLDFRFSIAYKLEMIDL